MLLDNTLLDSDDILTPDDFESCLNARGLYSPQQFVLRLNPRIHELIDSLSDKTIIYGNAIDEDTLQAYSTYIHETVHWWQHKGSTSGFIRSMLYPSQTHGNMQHLLDLTALVGPNKSIQAWAEDVQERDMFRPPRADSLANSIVNNFMDTEFYLALTYNPELATDIYTNKYFECAGHSFNVAYGHVLLALRDTIDQEGLVIPDDSGWENEFTALRDKKVDGYYKTTPITMAPVGLLHIMEGQARFIQLQFLSFATGGITLKETGEAGLLDGNYGKAFTVFLKMTGSVDPENIDDPLVALFMLICDLSINPTAGFPSQPFNFEYFYLDADPGIRFAFLCDAVAKQHPELRTFIKRYSRDEYLEAVRLLASTCDYANPMHALESVASWGTIQPRVARLMEEYATFEFCQPNIAVRILLAEFIEFCKDKLQRPEFFCWAGAWLTGNRSGDPERHLWLKHLSLYSDKADDGGIFPRMTPGRKEDAIHTAFNSFYAAIISYDMTKQWVLRKGPFKLEYRWLTKTYSDEAVSQSAKGVFQKIYGVSIDDFYIAP